ncbi:hypothetical protein F0U59_39190 [Archangium gephyra]|nr:hypothetical protein F0U59_39190 [Archangium gephyra]
MSQGDERLFLNGIDATTGGYLLTPLHPETVAAVARGQPVDPAHLRELKGWWQQRTQAHFAPMEGVDPRDLAETGWGVIFPHDVDPAIREALQPLLKHREHQASARNTRRYREYTGSLGYRPGETKQAFLERLGVGPGAVDPDKMPYYLLLVGSPEQISYRFQYQLDVPFAVGRLHFETPEEYARYARAVVKSETHPAPVPRRAAFFGVRNEDDPATGMSASQLVQPLAEALARSPAGWEVRTVLADEATKARLSHLLGGDETPRLLFTASHGMGFPNSHPQQLSTQGALLCQDWPGPLNHQGAIPTDFYFSGADVAEEASLAGLISFHFACYGAGTPRDDDFSRRAFRAPAPIAPHAFVARLPQRLLSHPRGGALAVVGHVERA